MHAFGAPGIEPRWTWSSKDGVGCAYSTGSRVWFTLSHGILNEVYYPTVDKPQIRDAEFLISDGTTFLHEEKRDLLHERERMSDRALGYRIVGREPRGRYRIEKEIIAHPHQAAVLIRTKIVCADATLRARLHVYALVSSHLDGDGGDDIAWLETVAGRDVLLAHDKTFLAVGATAPFAQRSVGYVGASDSYHDLVANKRMTWEFDRAGPGNVAMTGEIRLAWEGDTATFTLVLAFGETQHNAVNVLLNALSQPYDEQRARFLKQWERGNRNLLPLDKKSCDGGHLYRRSRALLLAHEDKSYPGAFIASLSIPWGEAKGDDDMGGYHLVWTRDMCNSATGLLASGDTATPLRALIYLACAQQPDGGFFQNFWIDGEAYWHGVQLDEVAFPIMLARRLSHASALAEFDPYAMVLKAARFLIARGPATAQERWEENSGYSPSTLAAHVTGLICAAAFARERDDAATAEFIELYADFLESHIERWTVTTEGTLAPGITKHYVRIAPMPPDDPHDCRGPHGILDVKNQPPGARAQWPAKEIVDGGFLELVRYGVRKPGTALLEDSIRVLDATLKVDTPMGPSWRRYNHDGYGQREDGGPFLGHGKGRPWPLLTGERGHYELAAGRPVKPFIRALEAFSAATGMLPEQVWDEPSCPPLEHAGEPFVLGGPTGAAMPLMWAHAEYVKLLRSAKDGRVFDLFDEVKDRYWTGRGAHDIEVWKFNRRAEHIRAGGTLVVIGEAPFRLRHSSDGWANHTDVPSTATALNLHFVKLTIAPVQHAPLAFTFFWPEADRWEGADFVVNVGSEEG